MFPMDLNIVKGRSGRVDEWSNEYHRLFVSAKVCPISECISIRRDE